MNNLLISQNTGCSLTSVFLELEEPSWRESGGLSLSVTDGHFQLQSCIGLVDMSDYKISKSGTTKGIWGFVFIFPSLLSTEVMLNQQNE